MIAGNLLLVVEANNCYNITYLKFRLFIRYGVIVLCAARKIIVSQKGAFSEYVCPTPPSVSGNECSSGLVFLLCGKNINYCFKDGVLKKGARGKRGSVMM
jgi:hypothetical protein